MRASHSEARRAASTALRTAVLALALALPAGPAAAVVELDITQGRVQALPIAVPGFVAASPGDQQLAVQVADVIKSDLERSGLFKPIDPAAFIEKIVDVNRMPRFGDWRVINAQALVVGEISQISDGRLKAEFRLWDVFAGKQLAGQQFFTRPQNWRRIGHMIADAVYERLTGEKGYFDTRIVFVDETGPKDKRVKRLAIMDQDGHNVRLLTSGHNLVLTPRFSPTSQEITYISYESGQPKVYLFNIETR